MTVLDEPTLTRTLLERQLLLERRSLPVAAATERVWAIQAQEAVSPYVALWSRLSGFGADELDDALTTGALIKATLFRMTLHLMTAADYEVAHRAMTPTLRTRMHDRRFRASGLGVAEADALVPELLAHLAEPRTNQEIEAWISERFGIDGKAAWLGFRGFVPARHAVTGPPWSFGPRPAYVAASTRPTPADEEGADAAVREVVRRHLRAFGPSAPADIAAFTTYLRAPITRAIAALGDELVRYRGPKGTLVDLATEQLAEPDTPAPPRLLAMWDSALAIGGRRLIPEEYRKVVVRNNGDVLGSALVEGRVAGVWHPVEDGLEVTAFTAWGEDVWTALAVEAASLLALLDSRTRRVHARYRAWWSTLPAHEVRVLSAGA